MSGSLISLPDSVPGIVHHVDVRVDGVSGFPHRVTGVTLG